MSFASLSVETGLPDGRAGAADVRSGEEHGVDAIEIPFVAHALHQNGAHHAAPADESNSVHVRHSRVDGNPVE
jgi:hypothetical protein